MVMVSYPKKKKKLQDWSLSANTNPKLLPLELEAQIKVFNVHCWREKKNEKLPIFFFFGLNTKLVSNVYPNYTFGP